MKMFLYLQPMIPPKRFDIFPPDWGMLSWVEMRAEFSYKKKLFYYILKKNVSFLSVWCPCMAINIKCKYTAQSWFFPQYYTADPMLLLSSGNRLNAIKSFFYLQPMTPPKRFDIFPPDWEMLKRSRCVQIFL